MEAQELSGPNVEIWDRLEIDFTQEAFEQAVLSIQEYIRQGDVFQVNLSLRRHLRCMRTLPIFMSGRAS